MDKEQLIETNRKNFSNKMQITSKRHSSKIHLASIVPWKRTFAFDMLKRNHDNIYQAIRKKLITNTLEFSAAPTSKVSKI